MNDEMKRLISKFLFASVIICCIGLIVSGGIASSQKNAKNTFDKAYAVMKIENTEKALQLRLGNEELVVYKDETGRLEQYEEYIMLTPLSPVYFFVKSLYGLVTK